MRVLVPRTHTETGDQNRERVTTQSNPKVAVEETGGEVIQVDIKSKATTNYLLEYIY